MYTISVIMRDNSIADPYSRDRYLSTVPCHSFEEARELVYSNRHYNCDFSTSYVNNGLNYAEVNSETGELVAEYFVQIALID